MVGYLIFEQGLNSWLRDVGYRGLQRNAMDELWIKMVTFLRVYKNNICREYIPRNRQLV